KPAFQTPMRGGLRWLDIQMMKIYGTAFKDSTGQQQIALVDAIAYPEKAKPEMKQGVSFFTLMRNLTATGFFSSEMGMKDIGYKGNSPTQWNGVPDEVLRQYGLAYTEKELKECVKFV
ncbi:MAG TPA: gluconate 2-dehydrogenase subunit 3 family protein, partial [Chitinophagaceae bacterium]|nr:gluconate 2-dehydrogenase subunit 3 family protein [Chitinophagaceae bacterium]